MKQDNDELELTEFGFDDFNRWQWRFIGGFVWAFGVAVFALDSPIEGPLVVQAPFAIAYGILVAGMAAILSLVVIRALGQFEESLEPEGDE